MGSVGDDAVTVVPGSNQLVGVSFDMPASPQLSIKQGWGASSGGLSGWGLAWFPPEDRACVVLKDPSAEPADPLTRVLGDWQRFRSTVFLCHLRDAAARVAQEDTQPFERSYGGRHHVMGHNGQLSQGFQAQLPLFEPPLFEPVGHTDTEYFLCWLLQRLHQERYRSLAEATWERLHGWLEEINRLGTLNVLWTDGEHLLVYQDATGFNRLHWLRHQPPSRRCRFENDAVLFDLNGARDANRTALMVATQPMSQDGWQPLREGEMLAISRGAIVWSSSLLEAPIEPCFTAAMSDGQPAGGLPQQSAPQALGVEPMAFGGAAPVPFSAAFDAQRRYRIEHTTRYLYSAPVETSTHVFRLQPVNDLRQRLLAFELEVAPGGQTVEFEDVFGNQVRRQRLNEPYSELQIRSVSTVEVLPRPESSLRSTWRRSTIPLVWMPWQRQMMTPYLLPAELPESQLQELFDYAMSFVERQDYDLIESLTDINRTIYRDYSYVQGVTTVETKPFDVFTSRRGVCQDFANLFICLARLLGIPARYRVGYIFTGAEYENKVQSDASHAWVEVYLPWTGWCGFDPTNGCLVYGDHIRVACGRNYGDATPTSGTLYRGGGSETLSIDVRVSPQ